MAGTLRNYQFGVVFLFFLIHAGALAVWFVPFQASLLWWLAATYSIRMFGVTAGYHRYFSHRSYKLGRVSQFLMALLAETSGQKGVLWWAAHHRQHHRYGDEEQDVHSPWQRGVWWSHVGWVLSNEHDAYDPKLIGDFAKFPELRWLDKYHWAPPLLFAADRSDVPLMRLLLELGADPLLPNASNTTPLMAAAGVGTREGHEEAGEENEAVEAVEMLLARGADVNGVDNNGDTPMHGAAANKYPRVVNLLANRGADPKVWSKPNKSGRTPLYIAEGYVGVELRPDPPTIAAVTKLMLAAGLSLEGQRPAVVDQYRVVPAPPNATAPAK